MPTWIAYYHEDMTGWNVEKKRTFESTRKRCSSTHAGNLSILLIQERDCNLITAWTNAQEALLRRLIFFLRQSCFNFTHAHNDSTLSLSCYLNI